MALAQGLRSVVVISLQAKEQAFGVLLLGTPDNRRFTPAELRLLLALGHQIGMAVENSYLVQQTSRRSEELHVLNEIGRALSSTLNKEDLLRKVWEELRRLFDVENFYIAALDPVRDEMHFDLEMIDGMRMPKRSRPAGNHLTEYVIRTRQPVLIRDNYVAEVKKLGVEPIRSRGCFCCVPLVAYDHAIGAMAVFSDHEHAFDEGHLELHARPRQRSQHRHRERPPLPRGAHQGSPPLAAQHHFSQRHRHAQSRRNARQDHRAARSRP